MERNNLEKVFNKIKKERGEVASIYKAFSDFPEGVQAHFQFYKKILLDPDLPLSRLQREYLAFSTSQENQCPYCIGHHREAFQRQSGDLPQQEKDLFKEFSKILKFGINFPIVSFAIEICIAVGKTSFVE